MNIKIQAIIEYKQQLNSCAPDYDSELWIIGGKRREKHASEGRYGDATQKYDPIGFEVGFQEFCREKFGKLL